MLLKTNYNKAKVACEFTRISPRGSTGLNFDSVMTRLMINISNARKTDVSLLNLSPSDWCKDK